MAEDSPIIANVDAEAAILGALMMRNNLADDVADLIAPEDFYVPTHRQVYECILAKTALAEPANPATLRPLFADDEGLNALGGIKYLLDLTDGAPISLIGVRDFATQVSEIGARRRLVESLENCLGDAKDPNKPLAETVDASDAALVAAVEKHQGLSHADFGDIIGEVIERNDRIEENDGRVGIATGIAGFDTFTGGFEPQDFMVLAGRPGMGKSAVACSAALGIAKQGHGVLIVSLEMARVQLGMRMVCDHLHSKGDQIPFERVRDATLNAAERELIVKAQKEQQKLPLTIVDAGRVTLSRLALGIRRHKRRMAARGHELGVVFVDYVQLLDPDYRTSGRTEAVTEVSRTLKAIANDTGIAVCGLAQLNREVEKRENKRPMLADLRESGQLEQDADKVCFLFREEYYEEERTFRSPADQADHENYMIGIRNKIDFIVAKRRNGRIGTGTGNFFGEFMAVRSRDQ